MTDIEYTLRADPLMEKKANFYAITTGLILSTWLILIVPVAKIIWSAAF